MKRNKLYLFLSTACIAGYIWLTVSYYQTSYMSGVCLFKHITNIPCPSCGTTRSVLSLLKGDIAGSLILNPFGIILIIIMCLTPVIIIYDIIKRKETLLRVYSQTELFLKQKRVAIPAILLVLSNWIWNIYKGV